MINRILFVIMFVAIGVLAAGWYHNRVLIEAQKLEKIFTFINAGPRFTAQDGLALCERIQAVERAIGRAEKPCEYNR